MRKKELYTPLDRGSAPKRPKRRRPIIAPLLVSLALVVAVVAAFWVAVVDNPDGGRPVAVAKIEDAIPPTTGSVGAESNAAQPPQSQSPQPDDVQLASLPQLPAAIAGDPSLLELSNFGQLPRVSPDGRRPRDAYARRSPPVPEGTPRIVLVVGGLGLSQTGTQNAIEALPEDVTLAFAPYGSSLERWVGKARDKGHEVILQIPLEPVDYPQSNPGDHTLLISGNNNRDDLHWLLGRMTAYAGVMNYMGSRFVQDEHALVPFLGEIGERGLYYLDDGSAEQDLTPKIGQALDVPVVIADRQIDKVRTPEAIAHELAGLEAIARSKGIAIGIASAFPASVDTIVKWVHDAEARGVVIVPVSAAIAP